MDWKNGTFSIRADDGDEVHDLRVVGYTSHQFGIHSLEHSVGATTFALTHLFTGKSCWAYPSLRGAQKAAEELAPLVNEKGIKRSKSRLCRAVAKRHKGRPLT